MRRELFITDTSNAPKTGLTPSWVRLVKQSDRSSYNPQPTISEDANGLYYFDYSGSDILVGVIDCGAGASPRYKGMVIYGKETDDSILSAAVPGNYLGGTFAYQVSLIGTVAGTLSQPVSPTLVLSIVQGDDYKVADGRQISWSWGSTPNLTGATVRFKINQTSLISVVCSLSGEGTSTQIITLELSSAITSTLTKGKTLYDLEATLSNGDIVTLINGNKCVISPDVR